MTSRNGYNLGGEGLGACKSLIAYVEKPWRGARKGVRDAETKGETCHLKVIIF